MAGSLVRLMARGSASQAQTEAFGWHFFSLFPHRRGRAVISRCRGGVTRVAALEAILYRIDQRDRGNRFAQHTGKFGGVNLFSGTGDDHDRQLRKMVGDLASDIPAAQARQSEIEHQRFRNTAVDLSQCRDSIVSRHSGVAGDLKGAAVEGAQDGIVLDDENLGMRDGFQAGDTRHREPQPQPAEQLPSLLTGLRLRDYTIHYGRNS